jgi:uncharacterized protein YbjT (DUF2867 family)
MRVLVTGANGFIGGHLTAALLAAGHQVAAAVRDEAGMRRRFPTVSVVAADLNRDTDMAAWRPRLAGVETVVNCAGIIREGRGQSFEAVHYLGPRALFDACVHTGVKRVIQISAISADEAAGTAYAITKKRADDYLAGLDLDWVVLRPSLVYGEGSYGGTSLMRGLAALPWITPLVGAGDQPFQPIHLDDLAETVCRLVDGRGPSRATLSPVGPHQLTLAEMLARLRAWLGLPPARPVAVPLEIIRGLARLGDWVGRGPLNSTALQQLEYGNAGPPEPFVEAIGFTPRAMDEVLAARPAQVQDRWHARLYFLAPLLRLALGLIWIASGLIGLAAAEDFVTRLLGDLGISESLHKAFWWGACALDVVIGAAVLLSRRTVLVGVVQLAVIAAYSVALTLVWPDIWLDPFGAVVKNIPFALAVLVLMAIGEER